MKMGVAEVSSKGGFAGLGWLATKIREADVIDCEAHGVTPLEAIHQGIAFGPTYVVTDADVMEFDRPVFLGVVGWTPEGSIWSLWRDLTAGQSLALLRAAPAAIRFIAECARRPLSNVCWEGNTQTLAWLRATNCFTFLDSRLQLGDKLMVPFFVKPIGDLP